MSVFLFQIVDIFKLFKNRHMAPVSLISQRPLSSEHDLSRQPNMLAYGRFFKKSLKIHFLF